MFLCDFFTDFSMSVWSSLQFAWYRTIGVVSAVWMSSFVCVCCTDDPLSWAHPRRSEGGSVHLHPGLHSWGHHKVSPLAKKTQKLHNMFTIIVSSTLKVISAILFLLWFVHLHIVWSLSLSVYLSSLTFKHSVENICSLSTFKYVPVPGACWLYLSSVREVLLVSSHALVSQHLCLHLKYWKNRTVHLV